MFFTEGDIVSFGGGTVVNDVVKSELFSKTFDADIYLFNAKYSVLIKMYRIGGYICHKFKD